MGEISVKDWSGGLNKRFPGNRISENECQDATDLNLTNFKLSPVKGVDTGNTASGDYKFRGEWVTDSTADKFVEYGDSLISSYDSGTKLAKFTRLNKSGGLATAKDIGVPRKPSTAPIVSVQLNSTTTSTAGNSTSPALCYHSVTAEFGPPNTKATDVTGGVAEVAPSEAFSGVTDIWREGDRVSTFDGTFVRVYEVSGTQTLNLQWISDDVQHKDKTWFQTGYWIGVSKTGASVVNLTGDKVHTVIAIADPAYTTAVYDNVSVRTLTSGGSYVSANGYKDGWVDGATDDYWSATSSDGNLYVSKVREGYWWTQNGPFHYGSSTDTGRVLCKVRNGDSKDTKGFGRTFAVIRKEDSKLKINGHEDGETVTIASVDYTVAHSKVASTTRDGFIFEWYDMHPNLNSSTGYVSARKGWAYLSTEPVFRNYFTGASDKNYFIPGHFTSDGEITFEVETTLAAQAPKDFLVVLGFADSQATFTTTTDKSWSVEADSSQTSYSRMLFTEDGAGTSMVLWDETDKRINYININNAISNNTNVSNHDLVYPDPHQYKGQSEYLWGNLPEDIRVGDERHNTGAVYKLKSTYFATIPLSATATTPNSSYHNATDHLEPYYGSDKSTLSSVWYWRENNRSVTLCGNVAGGIIGQFISTTIEDSHAAPKGLVTTNMVVDKTAAYTRDEYDTAAEKFFNNSETKRELVAWSKYGATYKESEVLKSFSGLRTTSNSYVFFARGHSTWGDGSYQFRKVVDSTSFSSTVISETDPTQGWCGFDLAHSHASAVPQSDKILFYNPNLDVLDPEVTSTTFELRTRRYYGLSGAVLSANYLKGSGYEFLCVTADVNETQVVDILDSNERGVYTLPFESIDRYGAISASGSLNGFFGAEKNATGDQFTKYMKGYVFKFSELGNDPYASTLPAVDIKSYDSSTLKGSGDIVTHFSEDVLAPRRKHILFSTTSDESWDGSLFKLEFNDTRTVVLTVIEESHTAAAVYSAGYTGLSHGLEFSKAEDKLRVQIGDRVYLSGSSTAVTVNNKSDAFPTATELDKVIEVSNKPTGLDTGAVTISDISHTATHQWVQVDAIQQKIKIIPNSGTMPSSAIPANGDDVYIEFTEVSPDEDPPDGRYIVSDRDTSFFQISPSYLTKTATLGGAIDVTNNTIEIADHGITESSFLRLAVSLTLTCTTVDGSPTVTTADTSSLEVGMDVISVGSQIPGSTTIATIPNSTSFTLSANAAGDGTDINLTFDYGTLPSPLSASTSYRAINVTNDKFRLVTHANFGSTSGLAFSAYTEGPTETLTANATYTVPTGVYFIKVKVRGAGGGRGGNHDGTHVYERGGEGCSGPSRSYPAYGGDGGNGGYVEAVLKVDPGEEFGVVVSQVGAVNTNGGVTSFTRSVTNTTANSLTATGGVAGTAGIFDLGTPMYCELPSWSGDPPVNQGSGVFIPFYTNASSTDGTDGSDSAGSFLTSGATDDFEGTPTTTTGGGGSGQTQSAAGAGGSIEITTYVEGIDLTSTGSGEMTVYATLTKNLNTSTEACVISTNTFVDNGEIRKGTHGLGNNEKVLLTKSTPGTLPAGLSNKGIYYIIDSQTNEFKLSAVRDGAVELFSALGSDDMVISRLTDVPYTFKRFVHKNRVWINKADYTKVNINLDLPYWQQDTSGGNYTSYPEADDNHKTASGGTGNPLAGFKEDVGHASVFDFGIGDFTSESLIFNYEAVPIKRSSQHLIWGGDYFYLDFDRSIVTEDAAKTTLGKKSFTIKHGDLQVDGGIPYQYAYSYMREIGEAGEKYYFGVEFKSVRMGGIEGAASELSPEIPSGLGNGPNNFLRVLISGIPDDITRIRIYRLGGNYADRLSYIADADVVDNTVVFDDLSDTVSALTINPKPYATPPSENLYYLTYAKGFFFAADDSRLRISDFGTFNSWDETAYIDFDSRITGIEEFNGVTIVFTDGGVFQIEGNEATSMWSRMVPDSRGLPESNRKTLTKFGSNLIWLGYEGVCMYSNDGIQLVSNARGDSELFKMNLPHGFVKENVYYLLQTPEKDVERKGFSIDFRKGVPPCISRISQDTEAVIELPSENRVYTVNTVNTSNNGAFLEGDEQSATLKSREYDGGSASDSKIFMNAKLVYSGSGTISFFADDETTAFASKVLDDKEDRYLCYFYPPFTKAAERFHYTTSGALTIYEMEMKIDMAEEYTSSRIYKWADVTYSGAPSISFSVDGVDVQTTPDLAETTLGVKTVRVSFSGGVSGFLPHYRDTSYSGEIISVRYETEEA